MTAEVSKDLTVAKQEILLSTKPVLALVTKLAVEDNEGFAVADSLLGKIRAARKMWADRTAKITDPLKKALANVKESLAQAKEFITEVDGPLEKGENTLRAKMRDFKLLEAEQIAADKLKKQEEAYRLQREADEKRRRAEAAKTPQMAARFTTQATVLETKAETVQTASVAAPVKVANSGSRTIRCWRVVDRGLFLKAVGDGLLPADAVMINTVYINKLHNGTPSVVEQWPGVEGYNDVVIVGGRR